MTVARLLVVLIAASALASSAALARDTPVTGLSPRALQYNDIADADTSLSSNKHAVILLDEMTTRVRADGSQSIRVHKIVRIQTPYGRVKYRMVYFQYNALVDQVKMEFAGLRQPDGKFVTYGAAGVKDTLVQAVQLFPYYHNLRQYAYVMPDPVPGSILEYQYVIERQSPLMKGQFETRVPLKDEDPIIHLERTVTVPDSMVVYMDGASASWTPEIATHGDERVYSWMIEKINAKAGEYSPVPVLDNTNSVLMTTWPSWQALSQSLAATYAARTTPSPALAALVKETVGARTGEAAMRAIYNLAATTISFAAKQVFNFQVTGVMPDDPDLVWQNRSADGKDHAAFLGACLRAGGFPATYALVNLLAMPDTTGPSLLQFNHVFVRTRTPAGKDVWLDSAPETAPFGIVSGSVQGRPALLLNGAAHPFAVVPMSGIHDNTETVVADLTIDEKGTMRGTMTTTPTGLLEMQERILLKSAGKGGRRQFFTKRATFIAANASFEQYDVPNPGDLNTPFHAGFTITIDRWGASRSDTLMGQLPSGFTAWPMTGISQMVNAESRDTEFDLSFLAPAFTITKRFTLRIPPGYRIGVQRPPPLVNRVGSFSVVWDLKGEVATMTEKLSMNMSRVPPDLYSELRDLWFTIGVFETSQVRVVKAGGPGLRR